MAISRRNLLLGAGAGAIVAGGAAIGIPILRREGVLTETPSRAIPVESDTELPASADVVIIGGGIQGVCSALYLAERGLSVVICEKGEIAGEQSGRAYSQIISYGLDMHVLPLIQHSKKLWRGMNERIGADTSYRHLPRVQTYANEADFAHAQEWLKEAQNHLDGQDPFQIRFIGRDELAQRLPGAQTPWTMGGIEDDAGSVDPEIGAPMIARYLKTQGVKIFTRCAVRGIETQAGNVSDVVTEKGAIRTSRVILAGGAWSPLFCDNLGLDLPLLPVYLSQQRVSGVEGAPPANGQIGLVAYRRQADGTYASAPRVFTHSITRESFELAPIFLSAMLGGGLEGAPTYYALNSDLPRSFTTPRHWSLDEVTPFERLRVSAPTPNHEFLDLAFDRLRKEFPVFENSQVIERWGGAMSIAVDLLPVISAVDRYPGLFLNTAHSFGMTQGPAGGQLIADIVTGTQPQVDPARFQFSRFAA